MAVADASNAPTDTKQLLLDWLSARRRQVIGTRDGMPEADRRASRVPPGWSPVGAAQRLVLDTPD